MSGIKTLMFLAVMVAFLGLACAAAVDGPTAPEQRPALLVRSGPAQLAQLADGAARRCTNGACASLCVALGWSHGFCLNAAWCLCYH